MQLLSPITFSSALAAARSNLENISRIVGKYVGQEAKSEFMRACDNKDYDKVNDYLDRTVELLSGEKSVTTALIIFALKLARFIPNINEEMESANSESDKVKVIASHKELKEKIKQAITK